MEQMIRKLYLYTRKEENQEEAISKEFQKEIVAILRTEIEQKNESEFERVRYIAFMIGAAGEENGFIKGFKYAYRLFMECNQKYKEASDDKKELEGLISRLQAITQKRAGELEQAIKSLGR